MARVFQGLFIRRMVRKDNKRPKRTLYKGIYTKKISTPNYTYYSRKKLAPSNKRRKVLVKKKRR